MATLGESSVGLRELRHHTSEVIARVRRGETIEVTEHGTPVARLVPFERPERPAILARLEAEGRLRPAKNPGYMPQRLHPVTGCLLYTSDAADDLLCVALGGRRIIK